MSGGMMDNFSEIRMMNIFQLKSFIRENRGVNAVIMSGTYDNEQRLLASQVLYAKNRMRLLSY